MGVDGGAIHVTGLIDRLLSSGHVPSPSSVVLLDPVVLRLPLRCFRLSDLVIVAQRGCH